MKHITASHLQPVLDHLTGPFDAHQLERALLRREPHAFARELLEHQDVTVFSSQFARWFDREFGGAAGAVRKTRQVKSANLIGNENANQEWEQVAVPTTVD